ncbi:MAG: DUF4911 domain-containing protein [Deltaproteobacteria bacterium]|nr:DUF4911 domain-containing protein [Deltaproteobacteria bacterium]
MIYLFYKVRAQDIYLIKFILESYENLMTVSTIDERESKIQVRIAADFLGDCREILEDLGKRFLMIPIDDSPEVSQGNY